jgi:hypothetical protein
MIHLKDRKDYAIAILSIIIIVVFLIITIFITLKETAVNEERGTRQQQPTGQPQTRPNVNYAPNSLGKAFIKLTSRTPLSPSDLSAKTSIINRSSNGLINQTEQYRIEYISAFDDIEVEILTTDIDNAKLQAEAYLKNSGLSQNGLCNLPVLFTLEYSIREKLSPGTVFNPLAAGC